MNAVSLSDLLSQISVGLDAVEAEIIGASPFHSKRVALLCAHAGRALGYGEDRLFTLIGCALLHDNALTQYILSERPNPERALNLKTHCELGEANCLRLPFPTPCEGIVKYHHEYADGSGAFGLREGEYPEEAELLALTDQADVRFRLSNGSPERIEGVRRFILQGAGTKFSNKTADLFLSLLNPALFAQLADNQIHDALQAALPEVAEPLTPKQLLRLSDMAAQIIDYKSAFTREHTVQIANKAWFLGGIYNWSQEERAQFHQAAALHDVGKLFIPTAILEKPGRLTQEEFQTIQSHALHSWKILSPIRGFERIALWACDHHEKLNGSGYPFGKQGGELDFNSRLLACLDIYQAVREIRPYHGGRTHEETMKILFGMSSQGLIDGDACRDLDQHFRELPDGNAPAPAL